MIIITMITKVVMIIMIIQRYNPTLHRCKRKRTLIPISRHVGAARSFQSRSSSESALSTEHGTHKTATARLWPWLSGKDPKGTARAEYAQGTPTQSHTSPNILVYKDKLFKLLPLRSAAAGAGASALPSLGALPPIAILVKDTRLVPRPQHPNPNIQIPTSNPYTPNLGSRCSAKTPDECEL